jgi:pyruvate-ferredoxin/flavodoxin oxidoreductase
MTDVQYRTLDANEAVATVAYKLNEVIAIYPITPASPMGEWPDAWSAAERPNLWGTVPDVVEMQSEGGAAGAVHGSLQAGSLTTTFTASQGLLLMLPNMYKIAGELSPTVFHIAARSLAAQALSIFGDHSDVMSARMTGWAMLASNSVQEAHDMALISHAATLRTRIPFLHFFDGFRTSHEMSKIAMLRDDQIRALINDADVQAHRDRAMSPDKPIVRGTAQNPDVYFQGRETVNTFYNECPHIVQQVMDEFAEQTGRQYRLYDYIGAPDAERVIILMGSGAEAAEETVEYLTQQGEKVGILKVRLYRPFSVQRFIDALPYTTRAIAVLDRTKEPGSTGEPLYLDVLDAIYKTMGPDSSFEDMPTVVGGRYGLSSKEFTPAMVKAIFDELTQETPKRQFTIGINDDVTHTSLDFDPSFDILGEDVVQALFYGLGSDGTVGANKNSIKIIGENTQNFAQGYFVYDSKKSGAITVSHLRFGPNPIRSTYLINEADFVACHQTVFLEKIDMLEKLKPGGSFLLNTPHPPEEVWDTLPRDVQSAIIEKNLKLYVIDAYAVARKSGMGARINTTMQTCFFAISGVLAREEAIEQIRETIRKTYGKKGDRIVQMNLDAVNMALDYMFEVEIPDAVTSDIEVGVTIPATAPRFYRDVQNVIAIGQGDLLPVSAMPVDGTFPTGTTRYEKRNLALEIPVWDPDVCIQCGKCALVCPHATIRIKAYEPEILENAPETFKAVPARDRDWDGLQYTIQIAPEDCTGCAICVDVCPAKNKAAAGFKAINMEPQPPLREAEAENWDFFLEIPEMDRTRIAVNRIRQQQVQEPLFEFSGACSGCGETPYIKLATQLFGDRMIIANATGCSSIYGGNLPTTPYTVNKDGCGPTWSNSLFEDNAEFGMGMRIALDKQYEQATEYLLKLSETLGADLTASILNNPQRDESDLQEQRALVADLKQKLEALDDPDARQLLTLADNLVRRSVWIIGGDGWAYDIGYGGLDHVIASGRDVNILILDTEVYSNTGGQASKATPLGAVAKFAAGGKPVGKKDLGMMAMTYGNTYVARVAMGAKDEHTLRAFLEAEAYDGPSIIIAYSHCIAHGINMATAMQNQKMMVDTGAWLLYRYNPELEREGKPALQLDSRKPHKPIKQFMDMENRFKMLRKSRPEAAKQFLAEAQAAVNAQYEMYQHLAAHGVKKDDSTNGSK